MKVLTYRVKTLAPVVLSRVSGDANLTATFEYIPGSSILGVFATRYALLTKGERGGAADLHLDEKFQRWFLGGDLSFGNAYLLARGEYREHPLVPTPLSIQTVRRGERFYNLLVGEEPDQKTVTVGVFCAFVDDRLIVEAPEKELNFHHARTDRFRGRSTSGELFSYEALSAGQTFTGEIIGEKEELKRFRDLIGSAFTAWLGRSRSAQYGRVEIELLELGQVDPIQKWSSADLSSWECVLHFTSPAIFYNEFGFHDVSLPVIKQYLARALGTADFTLEKGFARTETIESYVAVWKLKRPADRALAAGSVFRLTFPSPIHAELQERLEMLTFTGIGERRLEGFGRVALDTAVHGQYTRHHLRKPQLNKPKGEIPEEAATIFRAIIENHLVTAVQERAFFSAEEWWKGSLRKLPNSLLSRLRIMLKQSPDRCAFRSELCLLKSTAEAHLRGYGTSRRNLYDALAGESQDQWEGFFRQIETKVGKLVELLGLDLKNDEGLKDRLFQAYWLAFLENTLILNRREAQKRDGKSGTE